jgi:hypothetical protein
MRHNHDLGRQLSAHSMTYVAVCCYGAQSKAIGAIDMTGRTQFFIRSLPSGTVPKSLA